VVSIDLADLDCRVVLNTRSSGRFFCNPAIVPPPKLVIPNTATATLENVSPIKQTIFRKTIDRQCDRWVNPWVKWTPSVPSLIKPCRDYVKKTARFVNAVPVLYFGFRLMLIKNGSWFVVTATIGLPTSTPTIVTVEPGKRRSDIEWMF
jgi:hypothetical protein